jgi:Spy/CpxP family protein refolding chaperone
MTDPTTSLDPQPRRRRGLLLVLILALAAGLTGAFVGQAVSQGFGPGFWHGGGRHGGLMSGAIDPARIEEHAGRIVRHLAVEIDATADQQNRLRAIVTAAARDLLPLGEKARAAREQTHRLLTGNTVDRGDLEIFRAEHMVLLDAASRRVIQAIGDVAEVLTPEQRQKIDELLSQHRAHGWHRG